MVDIRQTLQYAKYLNGIGWSVERINEINYFIKKFLIIGSVIKIQRPEEIRYHDIKILNAKHRAFQIILEPKTMNDELRTMNFGFKLSKSPYLPTKTLHLDLTLSEKELSNRLKKDARSALRTTNNSELITNNDIGSFRNSWKEAVGWRRYVPPLSHLVALKKSFENKCLLLQCNSTLKQNAGAVFLIGEKTGYYWQAFTNKEGRKLQAQYKIVWEGILWAKERGAKVFDFEGIYDERFPNKSWLGFTHFKKSFGGYEVSYPGTFVKWFP